MRKGKIAAQAGHACVEAVLMALVRDGRLDDIRVSSSDWITLAPRAEALEGAVFDAASGEMLPRSHLRPLKPGLPPAWHKICVYVDSEEELLALDERAREAGIISALVRDAGLLPSSMASPPILDLALEPLYPEQVDPLTGDLPLY